MFKNLICLATAFLCACNQQKTVDIIIPIDHPALNQEVEGFKETFTNKDYKINVINANGDSNLQRAYIKLSKAEIIVPISTSVTQMAFALRPDAKVVGLASNIINDKNPNHLVVKDQTLMKDHIGLLKFLGINELTLIHSQNEKVYDEVKEFQALCRLNDIKIQKLMIQTMSDMYKITKNIKYDHVFILKDVLTANCIPTLVNHFKGTILASDEISVKNGATIALGVYEKDIGRAGGKLALDMLKTPQKNMILDKLSIFINAKKHKHFESLTEYATSRKYAIHIFDGAKNDL